MAHPLLQNSHGTQPEVAVDDVFPEGIAALDFAAEDRTLLVATDAGHLIKLTQEGEQRQRERGYDKLSHLVWSDGGRLGVAALGEGILVCFNRKLKTKWQVEMSSDIVGLAMSPFGSHIAVATESGRVHIVTSDRDEIAKFETPQPLKFLQWLQDRPELVGAAEFGHLCCHDLRGRELWNERTMNNVGDMVVTACGEKILLAAFNHGIQMRDSDGHQEGSFMIDGVPQRIAVAANRRRLVAQTLEERIYWLNLDGDLLWAADLSADPVHSFAVGPLADRLFLATTSGRLLQLVW